MKGTLTNGLLHLAQSFPCLQYFTVLPGNYNSLQHSQHLSCEASLVEIVPTQLIQMEVVSIFCLIIVAHVSNLCSI